MKSYGMLQILGFSFFEKFSLSLSLICAEFRQKSAGLIINFWWRNCAFFKGDCNLFTGIFLEIITRKRQFSRKCFFGNRHI
jgi:hypothetical protein